MKVKMLQFCFMLLTANMSYSMSKGPTSLARLTPVRTIVGNNVDSVALKGLLHVHKSGEPFKHGVKSGFRVYDVHSLLYRSHNRIPHIRGLISKSIVCCSLLGSFHGVQNMSGISSTEQAKIHGQRYYNDIFHRSADSLGKSPYEQVRERLVDKQSSRKACITINQHHGDCAKMSFSPALGIHFFIRDNFLNSAISASSTEVYRELPSKIAVFSLLTELLYKDIKERLPEEYSRKLQLGYTNVKSNITFFYDQIKNETRDLIEGVHGDMHAEERAQEGEVVDMPEIENAQLFLHDIYNKSQKTECMRWIHDNAS